MNSNELYFIWDYDLPLSEFQNILKNKEHARYFWLITRILEYARWDDIWRYLSIDQIKEILPRLKLRPSLKKCWEVAIERWSHV